MEAYISLWTEDCVYQLPDLGRMLGQQGMRDALAAHPEAMEKLPSGLSAQFRSFGHQIEPAVSSEKAAVASASFDFAISIGGHVVRDSWGTIVYKKVDGAWRVHLCTAANKVVGKQTSSTAAPAAQGKH